MTLGRMKLSALTVRDNIAILEKMQEPDNAGYKLQLEHEKFVLECIEKQIPKKVKYLNRHGDGYDLYNADYFHCPSCGRRLRNKQKDAHCGRCGQALDWEVK